MVDRAANAKDWRNRNRMVRRATRPSNGSNGQKFLSIDKLSYCGATVNLGMPKMSCAEPRCAATPLRR